MSIYHPLRSSLNGNSLLAQRESREFLMEAPGRVLEIILEPGRLLNEDQRAKVHAEARRRREGAARARRGRRREGAAKGAKAKRRRRESAKGRWDSDVANIYARMTRRMHMAASDLMFQARGRDLEELIPEFVQPA